MADRPEVWMRYLEVEGLLLAEGERWLLNVAESQERLRPAGYSSSRGV